MSCLTDEEIQEFIDKLAMAYRVSEMNAGILDFWGIEIILNKGILQEAILKQLDAWEEFKKTRV